MSEVYLAIYDLSGGMARGLSAQFLGPQFQIDAIPHTGVLVYGREYYFGGGIQNDDPNAFRQSHGLMPMQTLHLGSTTIPQHQFDGWCRSNSVYTTTSYDLLTRNCNNFSHDAVQYLGISKTKFPPWILEVPRTFLSSPMGQMVRPMLEGMQVTGSTPSSSASSAAVPVGNPWATAPSTATAPTPSSSNPWATTTGAVSDTQPPPVLLDKTKQPSSSSPTPLLDKTYTSPLVSNDVKAIPACLQKLKNASVIPSTLSATDVTQPSYTSELATTLDEGIYNALEAGNSTYALFLLRATVLRGPSPKSIAWIQANMMNNALTNDNHRALGWLVLSHVVVSKHHANSSTIHDNMLEVALASMGEAPPVQQAATAFLYNTVVHTFVPQLREQQQDEDLDDTITLLVCTWFSSSSEQLPSDSTACERQLASMGRLVQTSTTVRQLVQSLEWNGEDVLRSDDDGSKSSMLLQEIQIILQE